MKTVLFRIFINLYSYRYLHLFFKREKQIIQANISYLCGTIIMTPPVNLVKEFTLVYCLTNINGYFMIAGDAILLSNNYVSVVFKMISFITYLT